MFSRTRANVSNFLSTWQPEWVSSPGLKEWLVFWTLEIIATFFRFEEAVTSVWRTEIYFIGTAISPVNIRQNVGDYTWSCSGGYVSTLVWLVYCFASTLSYSYFLHSKNLDLPDCVWLLLDHNALLSCNHNALWHLTSYRHVLLHTKEASYPQFYDFRPGILGSLPMLSAKAQQSSTMLVGIF